MYIYIYIYIHVFVQLYLSLKPPPGVARGPPHDVHNSNIRITVATITTTIITTIHTAYYCYHYQLYYVLLLPLMARVLRDAPHDVHTVVDGALVLVEHVRCGTPRDSGGQLCLRSKLQLCVADFMSPPQYTQLRGCICMHQFAHRRNNQVINQGKSHGIYIGLLLRRQIACSAWRSSVQHRSGSVLVYHGTGVCEKTLLRRREPFGRQALRASNQWLECSFCCCVAEQRLV